MNINGYEIKARADLCGVDLCGADLRGADLYAANLYAANLRTADLREADLRGADIRNTVLDPNNIPKCPEKIFKHYSRGFVFAYRTRKAEHIDEYKDGWVYSADWFSTADTECHPGLYIWPTLEESIEFSGHVDMIKVKVPKDQIHKAGDKYRCRWFTVLGMA